MGEGGSVWLGKEGTGKKCAAPASRSQSALSLSESRSSTVSMRALVMCGSHTLRAWWRKISPSLW